MRSACWTVESRCAIVRLVRPASSPDIASRISASDSASTLDVASSSTRTAGLYTRARAMASSWRWPCETLAPRSPSASSSPRGSAATKAAARAVSTARARSAGAPERDARRRPIEETEDPLRGGHGGLHDRVLGAEVTDRQEEPIRVLDERDQHAEAHGAGDDLAAAVPEEHRESDRAQRLDRRVEGGLVDRR